MKRTLALSIILATLLGATMADAQLLSTHYPEPSTNGALHYNRALLSLSMISLIDNIRCASSRIIFGDQAMFVRRSLFDRLGGFPDRATLEDVYFCDRLVKATSPVILDREVVTDSRKFVKMGVWRSFLRCTVVLICVSRRWPIPRTGMEFFRDVR